MGHAACPPPDRPAPGETVCDFCRRTGTSRSSYYRRIAAGASPIRKHRRLSPRQVRDLIAAWNSGELQKNLSAKYDVSQPLISRILARADYRDVTASLRIRGASRTGAVVSVVYQA